MGSEAEEYPGTATAFTATTALRQKEAAMNDDGNN
jgi:hypothetical protein